MGDEMETNVIYLGDCLEVLKALPDDSIDACVSDVPYGLGTKEPTPDEILSYLQGEELDTGGDFMGRRWSVPSIPVWREVYRVLKPGAHVVAFGGTRTFDLISMGIRMAGFECRDSIANLFPLLYWTYGSGMPKSSNVSAAIDKKLGKERETLGVKRGRGGENLNRLSRPGKGDSEDAKGMGAYGVGARQVDVEVPVTKPASPEAEEWEGWGSGLKPSAEPILLFRKPFKGTLVDNVLKHGTGALNIDATRVKHSSPEDFEAHKKGVDAVREKGGVRGDSWKNASDLSGANEVKTEGRWPANMVMTHAEGCRRVGTQTIAPHPQGPDRFQKTSGGDFSEAYGNQKALDEPETMPVWECVEGCPVRAMDEQSGDRPSTLTGRADPNGSHEHPGSEMNPNSTFLGERSHLSRVYADAGGASRFFTQFESKGRWPANVVITHAEGCEYLGPSVVKRRSGDVTGNESSDSTQEVYGKYSKRALNKVGFEGKEIVGLWKCVEGCPVKELDRQGEEMGSHSAGNKGETNHVKGNDVYGPFKPMTNNPDYHADSGGVSRFFEQFDGVPFRYMAKANRREAGAGVFKVMHPTIKPLGLMRWLVKLVTPPDGVVLDPYCGSGSTCHAAVEENMHFIGIERDEKSHAEAERRMEIILERKREKLEWEEAYESLFEDDHL